MNQVSTRSSFTSLPKRNLLVAVGGFCILMLDMFIFVRLGQPDWFARLLLPLLVFIFAGFAWANAPAFPSLAPIWRFGAVAIVAAAATLALFFFSMYPLLRFQIAIGGSF